MDFGGTFGHSYIIAIFSEDSNDGHTLLAQMAISDLFPFQPIVLFYLEFMNHIITGEVQQAGVIANVQIGLASQSAFHQPLEPAIKNAAQRDQP